MEIHKTPVYSFLYAAYYSMQCEGVIPLISFKNE